MSKVRVVMAREFLSTVRRKSYLIVTFGMPFFAALYFAVVAFVPTYFMVRSAAARKEIGLVDRAGVVRFEEAAALQREAEEARRLLRERAGRLSTGFRAGGMAASILDGATATVRLRLFESRDAALEALRAGTIERFFLVPEDYLATGGIETYQPDEEGFGLGRIPGRGALERLLARSLLSGRVADAERARVEEPVDSEAGVTYVVAADGGVTPIDRFGRLARLAIPGVFGILLLMSLMTSAGYLLQGVSEEKENRVMEVILSSVRPHELLFGKLLGLGAAGLLQLVVWVSVTSLATGAVAAAALALLDPLLFLSCFVFFVLGFLLVGSLMTGTGALGTNARESQQFAALWSILTVLPPAVTWMTVLDEPNGALARGLGWFPLTAPITMMMRLATGKVPAWDVAVSMLLMVAGIYLAVRLAAALFRLGLLMYGKRPSVREILRHLRRA